MLLQHYHTSTNLSRKLDASPRYLQLQLGIPHNITLDYDKWGHLAPLSWFKMLWRSLHHFNIHLHMDGMCINPAAPQGKRPGCHGTDNWKEPQQKYNNEFEQMSRGLRNNIPLRHDDIQWAIFGAVCVRSRRQRFAVQVKFPRKSPTICWKHLCAYG